MKKIAKTLLFFFLGQLTGLFITLFWNSPSEIVRNYLEDYLFILILIFLFELLEVFYVKNPKYMSVSNNKRTYYKEFGFKYHFFFGLGITLFGSILREFIF